LNVITILESSRSGQAPRSRARAIAFHHAGGYVFIGLFALMVWFMDQASKWLPGGNLTRCRRTRRSCRFTCSASIRKGNHRAQVQKRSLDFDAAWTSFSSRFSSSQSRRSCSAEPQWRCAAKGIGDAPNDFSRSPDFARTRRMSYREIAGMPAGTVMSSLSRARGRLRQALTGLMNLDTMSGPPRIGTAT